MKRRRLLIPLAAVAAVLTYTGPAFAGTSYPPETLATAITHCGQDEVDITVDGVVPNSLIHVVIDFTGAPDVVADVQADAQGFFTGGNWPEPPDADPTYTVTITGIDFPDSEPFEATLDVDARTCPDLPNTGANSFPIGKVALGASLAGAFLIVIAVRRRPRDTAPAPV